jgi:hypothetical protein
VRIRYPDGTEVFTSDDDVAGEVPPEPECKNRLEDVLRRERRAMAELKGRRTMRQRTESALKRIVKGMWDYASGDGDDFDRALRMAGAVQGEEETPPVVLPDDED